MKAPTAALLLASVLTAPSLAQNIENLETVPVSSFQKHQSVKYFLEQAITGNRSDLLATINDLSHQKCHFEDSQTVRCQVGNVRVFVSQDSPTTEVYAYRGKDLIMSESSQQGDDIRAARQVSEIRRVLSEFAGIQLSSR